MATAQKNEKQLKTNDVGGMAITTERPDWVSPDSDRGNENVGINDIVLPRIDVLQALSPQLKKSDPNFIEGAEQGEIFNTVSGYIYGTQIVIVPIVFRREFINWRDRKSGGGFCGAFATEGEAEQDRRMQENCETIETIETHVHFVYIVHPNGRLEEAVLSMARSKRKISRKLNSLVQMVPGDRYARAYRLTAVEASGPKGDYWNFEVSPVGYVPKDVYDRAQSVYDSVQRGERGVDRSSDTTPETDATV
jgi:hypothetical protein